MRIVEFPPREVVCGKGVTPYGDVVVGVTPEGELCRVSFMRGREMGAVVEEWLREWEVTKFVKGKVAKGWAKLPMLVVGNEYQKRVWEEIMTLKKGEVETYGGIAERIGDPRTPRAVGRACKMCCIAYVIPCQRVIGAGGIGGFGSEGTSFKEELLRMEGWGTEKKPMPRKVQRPPRW